MKMTHWHVGAVIMFSISSFATASPAHDVLGSGSWGLLSPKGGAVLAVQTGRVLHIAVHQSSPQYYQTQLTHDIVAAVPAKTSLRYQFSARSATKNPIHVVVEQRTAPYTHYLDKVVTLTPGWQQYTFTATLPTAYAAGGLAARLQLGQQIGVVEFKNVSVSAAP